jgi:hypothetical protein
MTRPMMPREPAAAGDEQTTQDEDKQEPRQIHTVVYYRRGFERNSICVMSQPCDSNPQQIR